MAPTHAPRPTDPISSLPAVGSRTAEAFVALGIQTAADLLWHLPMRYEHEQAEMTIAEAEELVPDLEGAQENVAIRGEIAAIRSVGGRRNTRVEVTLEDDTGSLSLVFFNAGWIRNKLSPGIRIIAEGRAKRWRGYLQLANPSWHLESEPEHEPVNAREERYRPVYPGSESLPSRRIEAVLEPILDKLIEQVVEPLPATLRTGRELPGLADALHAAHRPANPEDAAIARRRLAYDELLLLQLGVMMKRWHLRETLKGPALPLNDTIDQRIRARLPFALTADQDTACKDIAGDLADHVPMNRLLQGDVGSGKTAVALYAMLLAAAHDQQAVLLAPTELLAEQHHASITRMLKDSNVQVDLFTGTLANAERRLLRERLANGESHLVIGTHALLSDDIAFQQLGLVIIDEQHRFGVEQRARLRRPDDRGVIPHVLVMTATPIPRTLAMTVFGDLDVSVIRHLPPGRQPVVSRIVHPHDAPKVYGYLAERVAAGEQGYVVVPAIDESDLGLKDVESHLAMLAAGPLKNARLEAVHGRLAQPEREAIMNRFRAGDIDVLVATVVIEVGVDVSNATMMVVEHAERFGLAQLHQLRGRVGRGSARSVCAFIGEPTTDDGRKRLEAIGGTEDGFEIAELDLEIRGPGEFFGARQSGLPPFRVADLLNDHELLRLARRDASDWIQRDPRLQDDEATEIRSQLMARYGQALGLGDVG
ncbi:MAG: ATP-dependent DNA helicase RecG [Phycisphaerales bacterium]|nr:ATP-dependent DNA helicase RecG [Phycisphaerales bacterium]